MSSRSCARTRRLGRRLGFTRNALCGRLERLEGLLFQLTAVLTIALIATSVLIGHAAYGQASARAAAQRAGEHQVGVTLLQTAAIGWYSTGTRAPAPSAGVLARWATPTASDHVGRVFPVKAAIAGQRVKVWMDAQGRPVPAPASTISIIVQSSVEGVGAATVGGLALLLTAFFGFSQISRLRRAGIAAEWDRIEPQWTHRRGRDGGDQPQGPAAGPWR